MTDFAGRIAVVTGGGTGMGRALVRRLISEGCHVATCDVVEENLNETAKITVAEAPQGIRFTTHICDVANEDDVQRFATEVARDQKTKHINLLFNNAGVGGGGSLVNAERGEWERAFNINWNGVYLCTRTFLPLLLSSDEGHIINTSSVNGFRASLGGNIPHTAYSAAKFAVRGFTEALINDFRFNAPHLKATVVMPGGVGTDIARNTSRLVGEGDPATWSDEVIDEMRNQWQQRPLEHLQALNINPALIDMTNDEVRAYMAEREDAYRNIGITPDAAADIILSGVRKNYWRILVGKDAEALDRAVRKHPHQTYDLDFNKLVQAEWQN